MRRLLAAAVAVASATTMLLPGIATAHEPEDAATQVPVVDGVTAPPIIPFSTWSGPLCPATPEPTSFHVDRLVVHHTSEPVARSRDTVAATLREICTIHLARGFDTIGYHYAVDPWGRVWQARGALPGADGRAPTAQLEGAHVAGTNPGAVGVVFVGDHELGPPTAEAVEAATQLLAWLNDATGLDPAEEVVVDSTGAGTALAAGAIRTHVLDGHNDTNATLCPGRHLDALMPAIRDEVRARVARAAAGTAPATPGTAATATGAAGTGAATATGSAFTERLGLRAADEVYPAPPVTEANIATEQAIMAAPPLPDEPAARLRLLAMLALLGVVAATWRTTVPD